MVAWLIVCTSLDILITVSIYNGMKNSTEGSITAGEARANVASLFFLLSNLLFVLTAVYFLANL